MMSEETEVTETDKSVVSLVHVQVNILFRQETEEATPLVARQVWFF